MGITKVDKIKIQVDDYFAEGEDGAGFTVTDLEVDFDSNRVYVNGIWTGLMDNFNRKYKLVDVLIFIRNGQWRKMRN